MKNKLLKATTLLCLTVTLGGCNKEGSAIGDSTDVNPTRNPIEQLRTFRRQIAEVKANPHAKSDETITLADALWDVENTFNLTYSDAESYYSVINEHVFTLCLPVNTEHQASVTDVVNLYEQAVVQAREAYISDPFDEKGFISLTVVDTEETRGQISVTFSGKTGARTNYNPSTPHLDGPFGIDDNWMWASPLGKCDDPDIPSGADKQLQEKLYIALIEPYIEAASGFRNIYVDRQRFIFDGTTYNGVYYNSDINDMCIEQGYMNDHYQAEKRIISQTIPNQYQLIGYTPISIEIEGIILDNALRTHQNEIEYGIRTEVSTDEFGGIEDLLAY